MLPVSLPIRLLGQLGYKNLEILRKMYPDLQHLEFTRIDNFYELLICCRTNQQMLTNGAMKLLLSQRLMRMGRQTFQPRKEYFHLMTIINRIYRVLNPIPNSGCLVPKLITSSCFNYNWVTSIKFHEIYPVMAIASSSCQIWQIKSDNTFEIVSSIQNASRNLFNAVAFHPSLPLLATAISSGIVFLVKFNIDGTNAQILNTKTINKGIIWSIVFHPNLPIVYVSNDYGYLMILRFTPDFGVLLSETLLRHHSATINGIAIQRNGRFLATCSDDYTAKISSFESPECTQLKIVATILSYKKILCIAIHPTLDLVATGSDDQYARIWQINEEEGTKVCIKRFYHLNGVRCVQFDPFNRNLVTGCYDGKVRIWNYDGKEIDITIPNHEFSKPSQCKSSILSLGFSLNKPRIFALGDSKEISIIKLEEPEPEEPKDSKK